MPNFKIIIPCYNSIENIQNIVNALRAKSLLDKVFFIDDGSTDLTSEVLLKNNCSYHSFKFNKGKGCALRYAFDLFIDDVDFFITMDSDMQHDVDDLFKMIISIESDHLILGKRDFDTKAMPLDRRLSNKLTTIFLELLLRKKIYDSQCGLRVYPVNYLKGLFFTTEKFDFETEVLIKIIRNGCKIKQIPIKTIYGSEISHIRRIPDIYRFIKLYIRSLLF
ncbi:MAG: glycosyltransferase family 2 protein [Candidatus Delongbacteria bacterium]|nr:glycosyltransferase family 2 protein [Candidatus Delongbacteria bacterium]MBN2836962.1 glycosyltransferase family 2 protein [Candidatus Delongbacteria bacterium]